MALKDFHKVMAQTFHPCEDGNFMPLRTRSGELLAKAILFSASKPPVSKDKPTVHKALADLEEQCEKIHELVGKNAKDEVLLKEMTKAHDLFHQVEELCHD